MSRSIVAIPVGLIAIMALIALIPTLQAAPAVIDDIQAPVLAASGDGIIDVYDDHSWGSHSIAEVSAAFRCLENNGPSMTFRERDNGPVHFLCQDPTTGAWYDVIVEYLDKGKMELKSAFSPKSTAQNQFSAIRTWLDGKGATVWKGGPSTIKFQWHIPPPW